MSTALNNMKRNKAAGPDNTVALMIAALEEFGVEKVSSTMK